MNKTIIHDYVGYTFKFFDGWPVNVKKHDQSKPYLSMYVLSAHVVSVFGESPADMITIDSIEQQQRYS